MNAVVKIAKKNLENSMVSQEFPKCFDSTVQYKDWLKLESIAPTKNFRRDICEDCSSFFKKRMIAANRCVNIARILVEES